MQITFRRSCNPAVVPDVTGTVVEQTLDEPMNMLKFGIGVAQLVALLPEYRFPC